MSTRTLYTPDIEMDATNPDTNRIVSRIDIKDSDKCWLWRGFLNEHGYGRIRFNGKMTLAHRATWSLYFGEIPDSMCVCHRCDEPACCNPNHLFLGSQQENINDRQQKRRQASGDRSGARTHPESVPRGERSGKTTLKNEQVIEIRSLAEGGVSQKEIALLFGISRNGVSCIVNRKRWAHIT